MSALLDYFWIGIYLSVILVHVMIFNFVSVDDPLDSSPIHMVCGIWSVLAVPLIGNGGIIFNDINTQLLVIIY